MTKKDGLTVFLCYFMWGFEPLYWQLLDDVDTLTVLGVRIVFAAVFSLLLLALQGRLNEVGTVLKTGSIMKFLVPASVFLLADWTVYIIVVNSGHILDAGIGYYINPLILFLAGLIIYREKCTKRHIIALSFAFLGVLVSTLAFGSFPYISLIIAFNWAVYAVIKKNVKLDGVLSIAVESLILTVPALVFLTAFRSHELSVLNAQQWLLLIGSGVLTALPLFLYSHCVSNLPLIIMCFAQYLSPTFNLICGFITGESFTESQLTSFAFFILAIIIFSAGEIKSIKEKNNGDKL